MAHPVIEIGLIADVQYADRDDGTTENRCQRYREAPEKLRLALRDLCSKNVSLIIHLGDIINGGSTVEQTRKELDLIATIFEEETADRNIPVVHVVGNHCLEGGRQALRERLRLPDPAYFSRKLCPDWRLIVLDTTEMSGHSDFSEGSTQWAEAREYEKAHPMSDVEPQMSSWNGGLTSRQLAWFRSELEAAEQAKDKVIVASHHQIGNGAARPTHMAWNWKEICEICSASPSFTMAFAGHDHVGGYAVHPSAGHHFVTIEAVLEAPTGSNAYAILRIINDDRAEIEGYGSVTSRFLQLRPNGDVCD